MKVLFCDTEFDGWEESRGLREQYVGRPLECLAKYEADFLGLGSWLEYEDLIDFEDYDLIWAYLGHREMIPAWYTYPRLLKKKAPHAKVVFNVDYEGFWLNQELDLRFVRAWEWADFMHVITRWGEYYFDQRIDSLVWYGTFGRPYAGGIKLTPPPVPVSRRSKVCFIRHTNIPPIITNLEVIKLSGRQAIGIDAVPPPFSDGSYLAYMADAFRVKGEFYPRLKFMSYLNLIRRAYVGLDTYIGPSRFSYEMALLKVPVVHTELCEYGSIINNTLTCPYEDVGEMVKRIKDLRDKDLYREMVDISYNNVITYFDPEKCQERLDEFIKVVMEA